MISILLSTLALAQEATDAVAPAVNAADADWTAITDHYGPETPKEDICLVPATLPEVFKPGVVAVAKKLPEVGCKLDGVLVDHVWTTVEEASVTAQVGDKFKALPSLAKGDALKAWTQGVLVAFDVPEPTAAPPTVKTARPSGWEVGMTTWVRTDTWHQARKAAGKYTFDVTGKLVKMDRSVGETWTSTFYTQPFKLIGAVSEAQVRETLEQQGKPIADCMHQAWLKDPFVKGRARIQWTITDTKPTSFAVADPEMVELNKCYAAAIKKTQFTEGTTGTVIWSFSIDRRLDVPTP